MQKLILLLIFFSIIFSNQNLCYSNNINSVLDSRSIYSIGDTLSFEDQNRLYPVCSGNNVYQTNDLFSFSDINGNLNGGSYKITLISMNATW